VSSWKEEGISQVICQAELAAVPIAMQTWIRHLENRDVLVFVDNDPAKDALIHGSSSSLSSASLVKTTRLIAAAHGIAPWFARVASPSNIADAPSRRDFAYLLQAGAVQTSMHMPLQEPNLIVAPFE
jgi:hypothetical protein